MIGFAFYKYKTEKYLIKQDKTPLFFNTPFESDNNFRC